MRPSKLPIFILLAAFFGCAWAAPSRAANGPTKARDAAAPRRSPGHRAAINSRSRLSSFLNEAYNAQFARAQRGLEAWLHGHPNDIRALNFLAETILDRQILKENLFNGAAYMNGGAAFEQRKAPLPPGFAQRLNEVFDKAQAIEEARLKKNSKDLTALYWLGVTHSRRAEFDFVLLRSDFAALHEGKLAWKEHQRLLRLDPNFTDAYFVVGLANYALGNLPWYYRMVASLLGAHGNVSQGIQDIKRVARQGHYDRVDAKIVLVSIYERQKNYPQALALLHELYSKYPEDYLAPLEIARVDEAEGKWLAAAQVYDAAAKKFVYDEHDPRSIPKVLILYRAGQAHEHVGELRRALQFFHQAAQAKPKSPLTYKAEFHAAQLDQRLNHIPAAIQEYHVVADALPQSDIGRASRLALQTLQ